MSASYLRKYAVGSGADIYINIPKAGSANHAVGADWTPGAGDVKVSIDGAAAANVGTLPVAVAMGNSAIWKFVFTNSELTGKIINVTVADSATKAVDDTGFSIETYGNASALHPFDLATATQKVDVDTIKTNPVVNGGTITFPTTATLASTTNITAGTIATATAVTTVNGLAAGVITAASIAADAITDAKVASDVTIASVTGAVGSVTGAVGSVTGAVGSVTGAVGSVTGNVGGNVVGSVASVVAAVAITSNVKKNSASTGFMFAMTDSTTHAPATGLTVTAERSINGAAFGACANAVAELSNGVYTLDLAAADVNGNHIMLRFTAAAADDRLIEVITQP